MTIIHQPAALAEYLDKQKNKGLTIGFVPTMGALHNGHINLVEQCAEQCSVTVCSIFVNPTQFNDPADFRKYPNRLEADIRMLAQSSASVLFLPPVEAIYPTGLDRLETYELGPLENMLEGEYRPGHFQGVCQVMARLLNAVRPHLLFMGQKDYQQCMIIRRLLQLMQIETELITCATVREPDGLAMSSRNLRLSPLQRTKAPNIYASLVFIKNNLLRFDIPELQEKARYFLEQEGFVVDYVHIGDAESLGSPRSEKLVALVAAFLGEIRLIDNLIVRD